MEATREKIVRVGGCWELVGVSGAEEEEEDVSVADIVRGGGGGGEGEREEGMGFLARGGLVRSRFIRLNTGFHRFACDSTCGLGNRNWTRGHGENKLDVRAQMPCV